MSIAAPIVVGYGWELTFHRSVPDVVAQYDSAFAARGGYWAFDGEGRRLRLAAAATGVEVEALESEPQHAEKLADGLRKWLGYRDAIRESTQFWSLELLLRACIDLVGYSP